jgi:hypothetical protein
MFGFPPSKPIKDDAQTLRRLMEMVLRKYGALTIEEFTKSAEQDFTNPLPNISPGMVNFMFMELGEFLFNAREFGENITFTAFGQGKYEGFMLMVEKEGSWQVSADDGPVTPATKSAKELARTFEKMYPDATNYSSIFSKMAGF